MLSEKNEENLPHEIHPFLMAWLWAIAPGLLAVIFYGYRSWSDFTYFAFGALWLAVGGIITLVYLIRALRQRYWFGLLLHLTSPIIAFYCITVGHEIFQVLRFESGNAAIEVEMDADAAYRSGERGHYCYNLYIGPAWLPYLTRYGDAVDEQICCDDWSTVEVRWSGEEGIAACAKQPRLRYRIRRGGAIAKDESEASPVPQPISERVPTSGVRPD